MATTSRRSPTRRSAQARKSGPEETTITAENIVELAPDDIDPSFAPDRIPLGQDPDFVELIRKSGQQSPILVRPHPETEGRYQVAYGHRRLQAASTLGQTVRAIIRPMSDAELVVMQGQENAARRNLSYIERGLFGAELEKQGFDRSTIIDALVTDKAEASRLIATATRVPKDLLLAIGPAPKAGRPRWEALIARIESPGGLKKARAFTKSSVFKTLYSDERFVEMLAHLETVETRKATAASIVVDDTSIGSIKSTKTATTFRIETAAAPDFAAYLAGQLGDIYRDWKKSHQT